jgi:site-specific recombinase XerD
MATPTLPVSNRRKSPTTRVKPKRRFSPETLTDLEVRALLEACPRSASGIRNRALIAILYRAGLRISEALGLYPKDVDIERGSIRVLDGKGGKSRVMGVDRGALAILKRWLDVRTCCGHNGARPVFCTASGERLTAGYVRRWLPILGRRAGIAKRVHAHGFRHTHAAQLREEGVDIGIISKQLGHASISTTAHYLDHIAPWAVIEAVGKRAWVLI